jgi:hypothetical protein
MKAIITLFTILIATMSWATAQPVTRDETFLTTPGAPWTIRIGGKALEIKDVQTKPDQKSAYFLMFDEKEGMNVSVYIEPVDKCKTGEACRDHVLGLGNPAWGKYRDLAKGKIGDFSYFEFFRPVAGGQPLQMFDMYAEYAGGSYWVDLHMSKVLYKKADHALFENYIKAIEFVPKNGGQAGDSGSLAAKVATTSADWLSMWDAAKCRETYLALTSVARKAVQEKDWVSYCDAAQKSFGPSKYRKLVSVSLIKSLPAKPELSGAVLHYQSEFNRGPVLEFVSLTFEQSEGWTVSNYLTQVLGGK